MIHLASSSPRRKKILREHGIAFKIIHPKYHEKPLPGATPTRLVKTRALEKAKSAATKLKNGLILGADTIVFFRNEIIGKPGNLKKAFTTLNALQGQ